MYLASQNLLVFISQRIISLNESKFCEWQYKMAFIIWGNDILYILNADLISVIENSDGSSRRSAFFLR